LTELGHRVVVTGAPAEEDLAVAVAARSGAQAVTHLDVPGLCGLVGAARVVVSNDTGVAHLASAYATPSVVLFGPVSPRLWGPPASPRHRALHPVRASDPPGDRPGDAHGATLDPVLERTTVAEVLAAVADVLAADRVGAA
jgi:ADP-heptose:LPS heptosyltransferase